MFSRQNLSLAAVAIRRPPSVPLRASSAVRAPPRCQLSAGFPTISGYPTLAYPTRFPIRHSGYPTLAFHACPRVVSCPCHRAVGFPTFRCGYLTLAYPTVWLFDSDYPTFVFRALSAVRAPSRCRLSAEVRWDCVKQGGQERENSTRMMSR